MKTMKHNPAILIEKHLPERRQPKVVTAHCGCCCCCCCCLHSVGGLVGAALGSVPVPSLDDGYYIEDENNPGQYKLIRVPGKKTSNSAVGLYWGLFGILCAIAALVPFGNGGGGGLLLAVMVLPGIQLTASFAALLAIAFRGGTRPEYLQIGKITLGTILGTVIGVGIMYLTCLGSSGFKGIF
jgi:streptolysin S family bacteriocin protoxin